MKSNAVRETEEAMASSEGAVVHKDVGLVGHVQVLLSAQVGTITLSIDHLFGLKCGDVVSMNELLEAPLTLMLNGRAVARGELLAVDDHFGVRILELTPA